MSRSAVGPLVLLLGLLLLGGLFVYSSTRPYGLERGAIGFEGLKTWLARSDVAVLPTPPPYEDPQAWTTLRILPVYDNDMSGGLEIPADAQPGSDRLGSLSPREMSTTAFEERVAQGHTLVVLPKWREGIFLAGRAHPEFLIPLDALWFFDEEETVRRPEGPPFRQGAVTDVTTGESPGRATLYAPQALGSELEENCEPIWTMEGVGTLLAWCEAYSDEGNDFYVLSDPDLLDNHGLSLGDNAALALAMMRTLSLDGPIYVDPGGEFASGSAADAQALPSAPPDLARFFRYPFVYAWVGVALMLVLALWRGNVRFGLARRPRGFAGFQSKTDTIRASGRLMRLAGDEDALIEAYAAARMATLSDRLLGRRAAAPGDPAAAVLRFLHHRAPELGARFERAYRDIGEGGARWRFSALGPFESAFQEILDEFGRASLPPRRDHG